MKARLLLLSNEGNLDIDRKVIGRGGTTARWSSLCLLRKLSYLTTQSWLTLFEQIIKSFSVPLSQRTIQATWSLSVWWLECWSEYRLNREFHHGGRQRLDSKQNNDTIFGFRVISIIFESIYTEFKRFLFTSYQIFMD